MKNILILICIVTTLIQINVNAQNNVVEIRIKKSDFIIQEDAKNFIFNAFPDKPINTFSMRSFNLIANTTENNNGNINNITIKEPASCGAWTKKQKDLISNTAQVGSVFILESITVIKHGDPGTPYIPENDKIYALPNIMVIITD
jgi:hypothetical protein